eukprot:Gb_14522 [translate_table: standard]
MQCGNPFHIFGNRAINLDMYILPKVGDLTYISASKAEAYVPSPYILCIALMHLCRNGGSMTPQMCMYTGKVAVDGKVEHKFDMKPNNQNIDDYRKLCRERTEKSQKSKGRQLQDKKKATAPVKAQEMKRTRMDRAELEDILFKLFERQSNWTLKQLVQETDQPQQFVKEVLTDLGNYNKKGTNQGTYELKPEYKKTTEDMETN